MGFGRMTGGDRQVSDRLWPDDRQALTVSGGLGPGIVQASDRIGAAIVQGSNGLLSDAAQASLASGIEQVISYSAWQSCQADRDGEPNEDV